MLIAAKERANLSVEILNQFAPYMDHSTNLFKQMGELVSGFGKLMESVSEMPEPQRRDFMPFVQSLNSYVEGATGNFNELRQFYSFLTVTTNQSIADLKASIGMQDEENG